MRCPTHDFIKLFFFTQGLLRGDFLFKMRKKRGGRVFWASEGTVNCWVTWKECEVLWTREEFCFLGRTGILWYLVAPGKRKEGNWRLQLMSSSVKIRRWTDQGVEKHETWPWPSVRSFSSHLHKFKSPSSERFASNQMKTERGCQLSRTTTHNYMGWGLASGSLSWPQKYPGLIQNCWVRKYNSGGKLSNMGWTVTTIDYWEKNCKSSYRGKDRVDSV